MRDHAPHPEYHAGHGVIQTADARGLEKYFGHSPPDLIRLLIRRDSMFEHADDPDLDGVPDTYGMR